MRVLIVEDEPYLAEAVRDGLRLEAIAADIAGDGNAVLEVLVAADGGVVSAEELLERAWDEHANPFTNAVRITISALRKRLGEPGIITTVPGVGYRISAPPGTGPRQGDRG